MVRGQCGDMMIGCSAQEKKTGLKCVPLTHSLWFITSMSHRQIRNLCIHLRLSETSQLKIFLAYTHNNSTAKHKLYLYAQNCFSQNYFDSCRPVVLFKFLLFLLLCLFVFTNFYIQICVCSFFTCTQEVM